MNVILIFFDRLKWLSLIGLLSIYGLYLHGQRDPAWLNWFLTIIFFFLLLLPSSRKK